MSLDVNQLKVLNARPKEKTVRMLSAQTSLPEDVVRNCLESLVEKGYASVKVKQGKVHFLTQEGARASEQGLPETLLLRQLAQGPQQISSLSPQLRKFGFPAAKRLGLAAISSGVVSLTSKGKEAVESQNFPSLPKDSSDLSSLPQSLLNAYIHRGLVEEKKQKERLYTITKQGEAMLEGGVQQAGESIGILTRESLLSGSWKGKQFKEYDLSLPSEKLWAARAHPISRLRGKIREIFSQMGFKEMNGPLIESAFWNFDALFQPQDHPARDLADTFYISGSSRLPQKSLVQSVRKAHKLGWGYGWEEAPAKKRLLRTHTTTVSARTLASQGKHSPPSKFFCVGKVFRNEATDYKHLAEFFQVEGIIAWEGATFRHLLGTLKEFYKKLGFEKIRFRPSFFPYTEPSLEIEVFVDSLGEWMELGGAGIMRPEVSQSLNCTYPVLAWGLSLERPLMLSNKIDDIRAIYQNELGWLRSFPIQ